MSFANPTTPNLSDFITFVYSNGVNQSVLPYGVLNNVSVNTSGDLAAGSITGTITAGMVLIGTGLANNATLVSYDSSTLTGTVSPAPSVAISGATVNAWSPYLALAFGQATGASPDPPPLLAPIIWVLATYNLGMHVLLRIAQDVSGQTFFQTNRATFKLGSFVSGVLSASNDENTGVQLVVPEAFKKLSLGNLDLLKTPYGQEYLMYIQQYGPTIVGVS